ncbi:MAG: phosphatidate cytidylyltransferase [Puniceicoccales bacterium]|jgi:phosphatidate cytidylyltransferase|nr:phosphatidate cytidylyltransferase [Puniceicoccales bacterium]
MLQRIFGTILLLTVVGFAVGTMGASGAVLLITLFALLSQAELCRLMERFSARPSRGQLLFWTAAILLGAWYLPQQQAGIWVGLFALLSVIVGAVVRMPPAQLLSHLAPSLFGILYVPFAMQFGVLLLRHGPGKWEGLCLLGWTVAVSKLNDVGGLLVGGGWGRRPFAAAYSPQKTWEGFFGGLLTAVAGGVAFCSIAHWFCDFPIPFWLSFPLSVLLAAVGTVADLLESALKRQAGAKDSGRLIPGIGGCLDFCDSLLLTFPTAYVFLQLVPV